LRAERIVELEEEAEVSRSPAFKAASPQETDTFDDVALRDLFALYYSDRPLEVTKQREVDRKPNAMRRAF
jgi:hypothetical protein